ncbi:hypothetical protein ACQP1G_17335 [Nocardia sp. CA-107356]|uniref:hypothetical protein n=1 Tax=Nocardia sp. CA-107356 TaxID=3239972 RepID=UPI003D9238E0
MAQVAYCKFWDPDHSRPLGVMSADTARSYDCSGSSYVVVLGDVASPDAVLDINWRENQFSVSFLDDQKRLQLWHEFRRVDEGRMFLFTMTSWQYSSDDQRGPDDANVIHALQLRPDGTVQADIWDGNTGQCWVSDIAEVSVDMCWEPVPEFGNWASVSRLDRTADGARPTQPVEENRSS